MQSIIETVMRFLDARCSHFSFYSKFIARFSLKNRRFSRRFSKSLSLPQNSTEFDDEMIKLINELVENYVPPKEIDPLDINASDD